MRAVVHSPMTLTLEGRAISGLSRVSADQTGAVQHDRPRTVKILRPGEPSEFVLELPSGTVTVEFHALRAQPELSFLEARHGGLDQPPEARTVVHLGEVGDLVRCHIVEDQRRRQHQTPGKRKLAITRA